MRLSRKELRTSEIIVEKNGRFPEWGDGHFVDKQDITYYLVCFSTSPSKTSS